MRAHVLGLGLLAVTVASGLACIPNPSGDYEDYQDRLGPFRNAPTSDAGGGTFDGAPPTTAQSGFYYGACLSQLAFGRPDKVFNFVTETTFTPEGAGGRLTLQLTPLKLKDGAAAPPDTVSKAGITGVPYGNAAPGAPVDAEGRYRIDLGTVTVPGNANPITGRDVVINDAALVGRFAADKFCARLNGNVVQPVTLTLNPPQNVCLFTALKDGDPTPIYADNTAFAPENCPE